MIFAHLAEICTFKLEILSQRKNMRKLPHLDQIAEIERENPRQNVLFELPVDMVFIKL